MDPDGTDEGETRRDEADDLETALDTVQRCPLRSLCNMEREHTHSAIGANFIF